MFGWQQNGTHARMPDSGSGMETDEIKKTDGHCQKTLLSGARNCKWFKNKCFSWHFCFLLLQKEYKNKTGDTGCKDCHSIHCLVTEGELYENGAENSARQNMAALGRHGL